MQKRSEKQRRKGKLYPPECIAKRDKIAFLRIQCKEIEENHRLRRTRDYFKKVRHTKGTSDAKRGTIKDKSGMDLTEADNTKRCPEYTEELLIMTGITMMVHSLS